MNARCVGRSLVAGWLALPLWSAVWAVGAEPAPARLELKVDVRATLHRFTAEVAQPALSWTLDEATGLPAAAEASFRWSEVTTGNATRDRELRAWVDAERWPEGRFVTTRIEARAEGAELHVAGELTLRGTARPLECVARREADGGAWSGAVALDHRAWGLPPIRRAGLLTVDPVVTVRFRVEPAAPEP